MNEKAALRSRRAAAVSISAGYPSRGIRLERNRQSECVRSTALIAQPVRPIVVFRVVSDPLQTPADLLPIRYLYRLVGASLDVPDRELLGRDLFRFPS